MSVSSENNKNLEKKIYSEARGKYSMLDGSKVFQFEFPLTSTLEENYAAISWIKDKLLDAIVENKEKAEKDALKPQEATKE